MSVSETRQPPDGAGAPGVDDPPKAGVARQSRIDDTATPPLQRPPTSPSGIQPSPIIPLGPPSPGAPPSPTPPYPPQTPPIPAPPPGYSSQVIPQSYPYPMTATPGSGMPVPGPPPGAQHPHQPPPPLHPSAPPQVPPAAASAPTLGGAPRTGTIPAFQPAPRPPPPAAAPPAQQQRTTGGFGGVQLPRITVQYPQVGSRLTGTRGEYEVRDVIGAGEFGAVYECIGPFDQVYAVKMVRPSNRPYSQVQAEWARERSRLFSLRHPNIVYIYDSFEQGHLFYLALERCDHALKEMLGTPMQEGLVIEISRQLLAAVQFLHDNEVIHDDLHGGNVLITHTDRPTVKISDFGISHELRGMTAVRPNVVHHAIMAPEILATGYTSRQSDLYQVGLLLYWMLTGAPAIQMDVPYQEFVRQVADGDARKRAEGLGTPLGNLIAKMLRRREAFRYTSAREVWADLRELPAWKQRELFPVK